MKKAKVVSLSDAYDSTGVNTLPREMQELVKAKRIIEGECKLIVHIPGKEHPLRMNRIKHFIVRKNVIEFFGSSASAYKITNLIDGEETAKLIEDAIEKDVPQLLLGAANFVQEKAAELPNLVELFASFTKEQTETFRKQIGLDLREWNAIVKGRGLPTVHRDDPAVFIYACTKYLPKPNTVSNVELYWKNIVNAEIARTVTTA